MLNGLILESDLIQKDYYPVYAFYSCIPQSEFLEVCESFASGIGRGFNFVVCLFPDGVDLLGDKFDGVKFAFQKGEEVVVDYSTFYRYLNVACERYVEKNPANKGIQALLGRVKTRFKC